MNRPAVNERPTSTPWAYGPFEFVVTTILSKSDSITAKTAEGAYLLVKSLSDSEDVKSFRVFGKSGILTPAHVGQDSDKFPKWTA